MLSDAVSTSVQPRPPLSSAAFVIGCTLILYLFLGLLCPRSNALPIVFSDYPTYSVNGKQHFDYISEQLVRNRIEFAAQDIPWEDSLQLWRVSHSEGSAAEGGPVVTHTDGPPDADELRAGRLYASQLGLQGLIWANVADVMQTAPGVYWPLRQLSALLTAFCVSMILLWVRHRWGSRAAWVALGYACLATGFQLFSTSLYWSPWMMLLPTAISCLFALHERVSALLLFLCLTPAFLLKCASGFEFISMVGMSAALPWFDRAFTGKWRESLWHLVATTTALFVAFAISLWLYTTAYAAEFGSSAFEYLAGRQRNWSFAGVANAGASPVEQLIRMMLMQPINFNGVGVPLAVCATLQVGFWAWFRRRIHREEWLLYLYAGLASASWFVLQPFHLLFHPRYALWIVAMPAGLVFVVLNTVVWSRRLSAALTATTPE